MRSARGSIHGCIDFSPPFKRISMVEGVEKHTGVKIPLDKPAEAHEATPRYMSLVHGIAPCTINLALDTMPDSVVCVSDESAKMPESTYA